jgi:membrane peptidoglycan carboxypeptidase
MAEPHWGPVDPIPAALAGPEGASPKRGRARRVIGLVLKIVAALTLLGIVASVAVVFVAYRRTDLPDPNADFTTATTFVYFEDGKSELGSFAVQNRQPLAFADMPENAKNAVIAAENRSFWTDPGISFRGLVRAAYVIARGGDLQGGSTISQQYIKILYLDQTQRTLTRKFRELLLSYKINKQTSKEKILEGYLNTIYFGHGAYGIEAAAQSFFNVEAKKLTVPQAAVLASVINNPTAYDPSEKDNRERLLERYRYVIQSMVETNAITVAEGAKYSAKLPKFPKVKVNERYGGPNGFLLKMVESELADAGLSSTDISGGGLKITTTFDEDAQKAAIKAAQNVTKQAADASNQKASKLHAAIASVDVSSGEVLALYGGPDFVENNRNWATTRRPTASTFKTYALAAGLKDGYNLRSRFRGNTFTPPGDTATIRNEYGHNYGYSVDLVTATKDSINTAFVDMVSSMADGTDKVAEIAEDATGTKRRDEWTSSGARIPLGAAEVSPLHQAEGYAAFANGGKRVDSHVVKEVRDRDGEIIYEADPKQKKVVSEDIAKDVTYALSNVVENGTGRSVQTLNRPVAGKTGTNGVDTKDGGNVVNSAWFVGYTKQISTAVMYVAGNSGSASLDKYKRPIDSTFFGGTYPAMTWNEYMAEATDGQAVKEFDAPAYVNTDQPRYGSTAPRNSTTRSPSNESGGSTTKSGSTSEPTSEPSTSEQTSSPEATDSPEPKGSKSTAEQKGNGQGVRQIAPSEAAGG